MALTINTNISSIIAQRSLNSATTNLNTSLERMSTGYKINHAKDNAACYSIANMWETQLGSLDVAADNAATGSDMLTSAEQSYSLLSDHLQRIRDLTEQAANGTYASASLKAIQSEISARLDEITRVASNAEFNGIKLMSFDGTNGNITGMNEKGIDLQVGLYGDGDSIINLDIDLFKSATISGLFTNMTKANGNGVTLQQMLEQANNKQSVDLKTTDEEQKIVISKLDIIIVYAERYRCSRRIFKLYSVTNSAASICNPVSNSKPDTKYCIKLSLRKVKVWIELFIFASSLIRVMVIEGKRVNSFPFFYIIIPDKLIYPA